MLVMIGIYACDAPYSRLYMGELVQGVSRVASKRGNSSRFFISARSNAVARVVSDEMG